jgi:hypothetical protein
MKYSKIILLVISVVLIVLSCESGTTEPIEYDKELMDFAYNGSQLPKDFYKEDLRGGSIYYENTVSIKPLDQRNAGWFQLSASSIDTARKYSELSSKYSAYYRELISEKETDKFYEFRRVYSENTKDILLSRVHKNSYLDRSMYDFFKKVGLLGVFKKNNFNANDVKELIEYMWFVGYAPLGGKVYKSLMEENISEYIYRIYEISIGHGDFGMTDWIQYIDNKFKVNKNSGGISLESEIIKQFPGRMN